MLTFRSSRRRRLSRLALAGGAVGSLLATTVVACGAATRRAQAPGGVVVPHTLSKVSVEPSSFGSPSGMQAVYTFVLSAQKSVDIIVYTFVDPTLVQDLAADVQRGVKVRVILDVNREQKTNAPTFAALQKVGVSVAWASTKFHASHEKCYVVDAKKALVSSINANANDYSTFRDFGIWDTTASDVAAIEAVFNADFTHTAITPSKGADLVWSPGSEPQLLSVINGAKKTIALESEEISNSAMVSALVAAAKRGVDVEITMTNVKAYDTEWSTIVKAGGHVHLYALSTKALYIHAKVISADAALTDRRVYVGSINLSNASMDNNRELGIITTTSTVVTAVTSVVDGDFANCSAATDCINFTG